MFNIIFKQLLEEQKMKILLPLFILLYWKSKLINCIEFTIEIDDVECFYENFKVGDKFDFEYQVIDGDLHDFDAIVTYDAEGRKIFHSNKKETEIFHWITDRTGTYSICFYTRYYRRIYFSLGSRDNNIFMEDNFTKSNLNVSFIKDFAHHLHSALNLIDLYQTHHRLKETQGRLQAQSLLHAVILTSLTKFILFITANLIQIYILKKFFV